VFGHMLGVNGLQTEWIGTFVKMAGSAMGVSDDQFGMG
jgi:hypothetical protein